MAYLIRIQQPVTRKQLSEIFWPDIPSALSRTYLRNMLQRVKADFGEYLYIDKEYISFKFSNRCVIDLIEFEDGLNQFNLMEETDIATAYTLLSKTLSLYHGSFLFGFTRSVSPPFDSWLSFERQNLHVRTIEAYHRLLSYRLETKDFENGVTETRRLLTIEPFDELGHFYMMQFFVMNNELRRAQSTFERYESLLEKDLGISGLGSEIVSLYKQIGRILYTQSSQNAIPVISEKDLRPINLIDRQLHHNNRFSVFRQVFRHEIDTIHTLLRSNSNRLITILNKDKNRLETFLLAISELFARQYQGRTHYLTFENKESSSSNTQSKNVLKEQNEVIKLFAATLPSTVTIDRFNQLEDLIQNLGSRSGLYIINGQDLNATLKQIILTLLTNYRYPQFLIASPRLLNLPNEVVLELGVTRPDILNMEDNADDLPYPN